MFRAFIIAATVYGAGAPQMADYRPDFLDAPLKNFHRDINHTVNEVVHAAYAFDAAHPIHRMNPYVDFSRYILERAGYPEERPEQRSEREVRDDWVMLKDTLIDR